MDGAAIVAIAFWSLMYVFPIVALIRRADRFRAIGRSCGKWLPKAIPILFLSCILSFAMSGPIGFFGTGAAGIAWIGWFVFVDAIYCETITSE